MAYSESLAGRVRAVLVGQKNAAEKKMFGGIGFLLNGNMLVAVWKDSLIVRLGVGNYEAALNEPHVREFDLTGRAMKGWVMVEPDGMESDRQLTDWIDRATSFVKTLPPKRDKK
ncbi:MAG: TfoX/Sxy family protein [Planctomycetota bacterium]|nr:TfoX/Sxy family protein [Planctomycetota bacterium]